MKPALQGLLLTLLSPILLLVTLPLAIFVDGLFWILAVAEGLLLGLIVHCALNNYYPWWMVTPDDTVSPFGQYEETVRKVYARFGRVVGDIYWLAYRNSLFGLAYHWKPQWLKVLNNYAIVVLATKRTRHWWGVKYVLDLSNLSFRDGVYLWLEYGVRYGLLRPEPLVQLTINFRLFALIVGNRIDPIYWSKPEVPVPAINMDGRPVFAFRKLSDVR